MLWRLLSKEHIEDYLHDTESWAVVTGSTDGIGKAIATVLLSKGFNVLIHGRSSSKLTAVQAELQALHPKRKVETVVADFTDTSPSSLSIIPTYITDHNIASKVTIFVNNVATTSDNSLGLLINGEANPKDRERTISTGVVYFTELCAKIAPMMLEGCTKKRRKMVVNIGSTAADLGTPYVAVYAASKGYMLALTRSLALEALLPSTPTGLSFLYADVHSVRTTGNPTPTSFFVPTAAVFARSLVSTLSRRRFWTEKRGGNVLVTPYWTHELERMLVSIAPRGMVEKAIVTRMGLLKSSVEGRKTK